MGDLVEEVLCRNGRVNEGLTMGSDDIVRNKKKQEKIKTKTYKSEKIKTWNSWACSRCPMKIHFDEKNVLYMFLLAFF